MKKYVAFFLVFVLLLGLVGCTGDAEEQQESPSYSATDLLLFQAVSLSQQVAMSAHPGYLTALSTPEQIIPRAEIFTQAIDAEAVSGKLLRDAPEDLQATATTICATVSGHNDLALCSTLTQTTQMRFPKKLTAPTAVDQRYSEECHFVVLFTPAEDGSVSLWAYPLFADTAEKLLEQHFANATDVTDEEIRTACKKAAKAKFEAKSAGHAIDAARYTAMAKTVFSNVQPLSKQEIAQYVNEAEIIDRTLNLSKILSHPAGDMKVYRFPGDLQNQIDDILSKTPYGQQLEDHTRQMLYLSVPNQHVNSYGTNSMVASSILHLCLDLTAPGMTAEKDEAPVLVLMEYGDSYTVLLVFYPNQYNIYQYSFGIVPMSYTEMQQRLWATGLQPLQ